MVQQREGKAKNGVTTLRKGNETKGPERPWNGKAQTSEGKEKPRTEKYNKKNKKENKHDH